MFLVNWGPIDPGIKDRSAQGQCDSSPTQQAQNICITFVQRRPNVFDVGPTLYKCYTNVLWLLGSLTQLHGLASESERITKAASLHGGSQ